MAKFLRVVLWTALIVGGLIGVLRLTAIRWWQLPLNDRYFEASVAPALHGGDWVVLWRATSSKYGDLVLCPEPKTNRPVIGRIIGEQGDHLKIEGSLVTVNSVPLRIESGCEKFHVRDPATGGDSEQSCSLEDVGGHLHQRGNVAAAEGDERIAATEFDVPNGQVFLVSDNRAMPWDSRDFGPVDRAMCVETIVFRLISKDGFFDVPNRLSLIR